MMSTQQQQLLDVALWAIGQVNSQEVDPSLSMRYNPAHSIIKLVFLKWWSDHNVWLR